MGWYVVFVLFTIVFVADLMARLLPAWLSSPGTLAYVLMALAAGKNAIPARSRWPALEAFWFFARFAVFGVCAVLMLQPGYRAGLIALAVVVVVDVASLQAERRTRTFALALSMWAIPFIEIFVAYNRITDGRPDDVSHWQIAGAFTMSFLVAWLVYGLMTVQYEELRGPDVIGAGQFFGTIFLVMIVVMYFLGYHRLENGGHLTAPGGVVLADGAGHGGAAGVVPGGAGRP